MARKKKKWWKQGVTRVVAVLGPWRSGTSCLGGILTDLGMELGKPFIEPNQANPAGFYESHGLFQICLQSYTQPELIEKNTLEQRVEWLNYWLWLIRHNGPVIGAKHPFLCLMVDEMLQAWPDVRAIAVDRPINESVQSIIYQQQRGVWAEWWQPSQIEWAITKMITQRDADLKRYEVPTLRLAFSDYFTKPKETIEKIAEFCGVRLDDTRRAMAMIHINPALRHLTPESPVAVPPTPPPPQILLI